MKFAYSARGFAVACLQSCVVEGHSWEAPLSEGRAASSPFHSDAGRNCSGRRGWAGNQQSPTGLSLAPPHDFPRSGLVQFRLWRDLHNRNYRAFAQVRLAELVSPTLGADPASRRQALNGVMAKSVDFVICDVLTLDPVAAIEVDDRSHLLPERQQRDAFVNTVFLEIGLPLMRVKARRAYSVDELRAMCARAGLFALPRMEGANS